LFFKAEFRRDMTKILYKEPSVMYRGGNTSVREF
jgi:hypothetical protein